MRARGSGFLRASAPRAIFTHVRMRSMMSRVLLATASPLPPQPGPRCPRAVRLHAHPETASDATLDAAAVRRREREPAAGARGDGPGGALRGDPRSDGLAGHLSRAFLRAHHLDRPHGPLDALHLANDAVNAGHG